MCMNITGNITSDSSATYKDAVIENIHKGSCVSSVMHPARAFLYYTLCLFSFKRTSTSALLHLLLFICPQSQKKFGPKLALTPA